MDGRSPRHPVPRGGREAGRQVVPRRGRRRRRDVPQHPRRESLGRRADRLRPERRAASPRAGLSGAAPRAGLGGQRQREVDPPHRARRSALHDARGDREVHRPAPQRDRAHVQLRDGRQVDHHVSGLPGDLARARVVGNQRARLERPRPRHPRGREHRRRQDLGGCRAAGARAAEVPYAIPPPVELGRARGDAHEPRGGRDGLPAAHARRAPQGAWSRRSVPLQQHPGLAGARGRRRALGAGGVMRRAAVIGVAVAALAAVYASAKQGAPRSGLPARFGLGRAATAAEIKAWDIDVMPDGDGLPPGSGTPAGGVKIYTRKCAACHGPSGTEGPFDRLVGRDQGPARTIGNYWPYATTLYDYVHRAMPLGAPGSLAPDEVYSLVAYLLWRNEIIPETAVIDARTLPRVVMPARGRFVADGRRRGPGIRVGWMFE